ncbi:hypothetical protein SLS62_000440 [Diatrype stigma]|uniref:Uncharacterized protein n=1 Tax=Diatrype stigma TaxID=117547 RepID=A0AAN9V1E4_9PEZI
MLRNRHASKIASSASLATVRLVGGGSRISRRGIANAPEPPQTDSQNKEEEALKPSDPSNADASGASGAAEKPKKKTMAELDEELRLKMSGIAGDGGTAGVEYEDGKPVAMKRSVKNNRFRYI